MPTPETLCCPACHAALNIKLHCSKCGTDFPSLFPSLSPSPKSGQAPKSLPFLFPNPQIELARWEARAHAEQQNLREQQKRCKTSITTLDVSTTAGQLAHKRLEHLENAYSQQLDCLSKLLEPLLNGQPGSDHTTYQALNTGPLTDTTTLFSYASNLFRDWAWGDAENEQALAMLEKVATKPLGNTLVLGAGGGRLAWDIACGNAFGASQVTAVDINPFTTLAASQITGSDSGLSLWEFPLSPITVEDTAIEHQLKAKESLDNLRFLLADARALPFASDSFDTVLTPWFTDVVQESPAETAQRINGLLKTGGIWLNFGSVAFANTDPAKCLLLPELCAIAQDTGFAEPLVTEERGPYLCAPSSRYGRTELLHAFGAEKIANLDTQSLRQTTSQGALDAHWIADPSKAIPALEAFQAQAMSTQIHAYLMSLIDGKTSISEIAQVLEERRLMSAREAVPVVQGFLRKMLESG